MCASFIYYALMGGESHFNYNYVHKKEIKVYFRHSGHKNWVKLDFLDIDFGAVHVLVSIKF